MRIDKLHLENFYSQKESNMATSTKIGEWLYNYRQSIGITSQDEALRKYNEYIDQLGRGSEKLKRNDRAFISRLETVPLGKNCQSKQQIYAEALGTSLDTLITMNSKSQVCPRSINDVANLYQNLDGKIKTRLNQITDNKTLEEALITLQSIYSFIEITITKK